MIVRKCTLLVLVLFVAASFPARSQQENQGVVQKEFVFRFYAGSDMFIFPGKDNKTNFLQACKFIDANREQIEQAQMTLGVYGYSGSKGTPVERRKRVKIMSNRVKSEFIHARKAAENHFITINSTEPCNTEMPNAVVLKFIVHEPVKSQIAEQPMPGQQHVNQLVQEPSVTSVPINKPIQEPPVASEAIDNQPFDSSLVRKQLSPWYLGASCGVSFGRSTFVSFAMDKTHPASNLGVLGGYTINKVFSAEASIDWTRMTLGTYDCCRNLWLGADGNRYFAPLSGVESYKYSDLISTSNLLKVGAHLTIDLMGLKKTDSKWSALVSPGIYAVHSHARVDAAGTEVRTASTFHFGTGLNLGLGYGITPESTLRLTTGIDYLTGAIDGLPREEHKTSYVWNNALQLIVKLRRYEK